MSNLLTVQNIYAAFGRGDIPAILSQIHEQVAWDQGMSSNMPPWLRPRTGRAQVAEFFGALAALEFKKFQPKTLFESGNCVVALIDIEFVVKANGNVIREDDEVHIFRFDESGLITSFCHKLDTALDRKSVV